MSRRFRLLGADFEFDVRHAALARLVEHAYAGLPEHRLAADAPRLQLSLSVAPGGARLARRRAPQIETLSGAGLLCGSTGRSVFAAIAPGAGAALIVVSRDMLRHPYHLRDELIELAVFTLAARTQGLVPLHAACVGHHGRGLLVMGDSGAGKSTAALHAALRGLEFVSEDSTFVEPGSMLATGVANFLHVRRESLRFVPAPVAARLRRSPVIRRRSGVAKLEIDLRRARVPLAPHPVRIEAMIFATPKPRSRGGPLLLPLRADAVCGRLAAAQAYAARRPEWPLFTRRIAALPAFELRRGAHPQETAAALESLLTTGSAAPLAVATCEASPELAASAPA